MATKTSLQSDISSYKSSIASAKAQILVLQQEIPPIERTRAELDARRKGVIGELDAVHGKYRAQSGTVSRYTTLIQEEEAQMAQLDGKCNEQQGLIQQRVTETIDGLRPIFLANRDAMQNVELGDSAEANAIEDIIKREWKDNQARVQGIRRKMADNSTYQTTIGTDIDATGLLLGDAQEYGTHAGVRHLVRDLQDEVRKRSSVDASRATQYYLEFTQLCSTIRGELRAKNLPAQAGNLALFLSDGRHPESDNLIDERQVSLEKGLVDQTGIDPRIARAYSMLAINRDWQQSNASDFLELQQQDLDYYTRARQIVQETEKGLNLVTRCALWLQNNHCLNAEGYLLPDSTLRANGLHLFQVQAVAYYGRQRARELVAHKVNLGHRDEIERQLTDVRQRIGEQAAAFDAYMKKVVEETLPGEVATTLDTPMGSLKGRVSLAQAVEERDRLEQHLNERKAELGQTQQAYKSLEGELADAANATGAVEYRDAIRTFSDYISKLVDAGSVVGAMPPQISDAVQKADAYIDERRASIKELEAALDQHMGTRTGYAQSRDAEQATLDGIAKEKEGIKARLGDVDRDLSSIAGEIEAKQSAIQAQQEKINGYKRQISTCELKIEEIDDEVSSTTWSTHSTISSIPYSHHDSSTFGGGFGGGMGGGGGFSGGGGGGGGFG